MGRFNETPDGKPLPMVIEPRPGHRAVLLWRYWEKRSARDMAARSGRTEKAIEQLLARARHEFGPEPMSMPTATRRAGLVAVNDAGVHAAPPRDARRTGAQL